MMSDIAGPLMVHLRKAPEDIQEEIIQSILQVVQTWVRDGKVYADWEAIIAMSQKPG